MTEHGFAGDDIAEIAIEASEKVVSHHQRADPADIMLAQYSVPFCVALSAYHDPLDPDCPTTRAGRRAEACAICPPRARRQRGAPQGLGRADCRIVA